MDAQRQTRITAGATLVVVGLLLFFLQHMRGLADTVVFAVLGAVFLVGYLWKKSYGLLVPAGILLGLAVGSYFEEITTGGADWTLFGLGCGFFLIYGLDLLYRRRRMWWPVVTGAILVVLAFPVTKDLVDLVVDHWPLLLVILGLGMVVFALVGPRGSRRAGG